MNEVAVRENTGVTNLDEGAYNPFEAYGNSVSNRSITGQLLKFNKGDWLYGEDNEELDAGTNLVADMDTLNIGWIRWQDNKPDQQIMGRIVDRFKPPRRAELGDTDEETWEIDNQGKARDPWQFSNYLMLKVPGEPRAEDDSNIFTLAGSSKGLLGAIGELCKAYGQAMRAHPDENPVIELGVDSYNHPNKEYGRIKVPVLKIVGWEPKVFEEVKKVTAAKKAPPKGKAASSKR